MPYISIDDFKLGMDARKPRVTGIPGSLSILKNGHITRGGHVQRMKKFVDTYTLPVGGSSGDASVKFSITNGTVGASNEITSITIDSVELLGSAVAFDTNNATTATAVKTEINANTSGGLGHGYTATSSDAGVTVNAPSGTTTSDNGDVVIVTPGGDVGVAGEGFREFTKFLMAFENTDGGSGDSPTELTGNHDNGVTFRDSDIYPLTSGPRGLYPQFPGTGTVSGSTAAWIQFDDHADYKPTGEFTFEFWLRPAPTGAYRNIMGKWAITGKSWRFRVNPSGSVQFRWDNESFVLGTPNLVDNEWAHIAVTRNAANLITIWLNGVPGNSGTDAGGPANSVQIFSIGAIPNSVDLVWSGGVDDFRLTHKDRYGSTDFSNNLPATLVSSYAEVTDPSTMTLAMAGGFGSATGVTFNLHAQGGNLFTFGGFAEPGGMPSAITYQRLAHKTDPGGTQISKILDTENFDGKIYAIAEYTDGAIYHFYDGARVTSWDNIASTVSTNDLVASALKTKIDLDPDFDATVSTNTVTVTAAVAGTGFTIAATAQNFGSINDQVVTLAEVTANDAGGSEVLATGTATVTGGTPNTASEGSVDLTGGGTGSVDGILVNGVEIMSGAESFDTNLTVTATAVAANITANTSAPDYNATAVGTLITITALQSAGADPNSFTVVSSATTITTTDVNMGTVTTGVTNALTSLKVDGVEILTGRVNYAPEGSNTETAEDIEADIDAATSSPDYDGSNIGGVITITAKAGTGAGPNSFVVQKTVAGDMTVGATNMAGGAASSSAAKQQWTAAITGTFESADIFTITLDGKDFVVQGGSTGTGKTVLTWKQKLYSTVASLLAFSGLNTPHEWEPPAIGAGNINFSTQDSGSETLEGTGIFQGNIAVFADSVIQIEFVDVDETANTLLHTVRNVGTRSHRSVVQFGNNDLFFLDENSGVRSLRARDSSMSPETDDVGTPLDDHILAHMDTLTDAQITDAIGLIGLDGRYWLSLDQRIYVFTFFKNSKISAWSFYDPEIGSIDAMVRIKKDIYVRSDNSVYLFGGSAGETYPDADETLCTVELPFMDLDKAAHMKTLEGFDMAALNVWDITVQIDPDNDAVESTEFTVSNTTYTDDAVGGLSLRSSHFAPKLICSAAGLAELYNLVIHYQLDEAE